ncbi:hypothetical protein AVEN_149595-1 [Araneus ventricosus]|uniref:HTH CENPB-type domain-containing protein n=1 Tax=Araneus ventricosus TaxID=182803 RepID=A0A4Y2TH78_ARAVE|nr:hypothetical protein AVEN_149595-1 [Araneus ventricosus]
MMKSKFDEIEEVLVRWLKHARSQNVPISALILKEKAMEISEELNNEDFGVSSATVKALTSEFLEENQNSSGEDNDAENMDQTPSNKSETIEALEKVRQYLTSIQGTTDEEFKALSILEKKVIISNNQQLH